MLPANRKKWADRDTGTESEDDEVTLVRWEAQAEHQEPIPWLEAEIAEMEKERLDMEERQLMRRIIEARKGRRVGETSGMGRKVRSVVEKVTVEGRAERGRSGERRVSFGDTVDARNISSGEDSEEDRVPEATKDRSTIGKELKAKWEGRSEGTEVGKVKENAKGKEKKGRKGKGREPEVSDEDSEKSLADRMERLEQEREDGEETNGLELEISEQEKGLVEGKVEKKRKRKEKPGEDREELERWNIVRQEMERLRRWINKVEGKGTVGNRMIRKFWESLDSMEVELTGIQLTRAMADVGEDRERGEEVEARREDMEDVIRVVRPTWWEEATKPIGHDDFQIVIHDSIEFWSLKWLGMEIWQRNFVNAGLEQEECLGMEWRYGVREKERGREKATYKVKPGLWLALADREQRWLRIGQEEHRYRLHVQVVQCFKCKRYGHMHEKCEFEFRGRGCGGQQHGKCDRVNCLSCADEGLLEVNHRANSEGCPTNKAILRTRRERLMEWARERMVAGLIGERPTD